MTFHDDIHEPEFAAIDYCKDVLQEWFENRIDDKELLHRLNFYKRKKQRGEMR